MLYNFEVSLAGLVLLSPLVVLAVTWARCSKFYRSRPVPKPQKVLYCVALVAASASTLAYIGYWGWRACSLYEISIPFTTLLVLERFMYVSRLLSPVAVGCFFFGRGPYRFLAIAVTLWVTLQVWLHHGVIHWA